MVSMVMSFCAVLFPTRAVLGEILNSIESVSEGFPSYSCYRAAPWCEPDCTAIVLPHGGP